MTPAIVVIDGAAVPLARRIAEATGGDVHGLSGRVAAADVAFASVGEHLADLFSAGRPIVGLCAAGILVRSLGALTADKRAEPPVVAVSQDGASVVPLLGGHRGANALSREIAALTGGHAAITTAGEAAFDLALDAPPSGWRLANPEDAKAVMAALICGAGAEIAGELPWLDAERLAGSDPTIRLVASEKAAKGNRRTLVYHPLRYVLGVGAARDCPPEELRELAEGALAEAGIAAGAVAAIASIDIKADERAILDLAEALRLPFRLFDAATLEAETPRLANPSEIVFREVGCHGVAEGAALAGAGADAVLTVPKRKSANATVALARAAVPLDPAAIGRAPGRLSVVGIGPGAGEWRTPEAARLIASADEVVGYGLYLDLVAALVPAARRTAFSLGEETERCIFALERAAEGRHVALVSSGDAGIYAMAALVEELIAERRVSPAARRVAVEVAPGISALQAAAARIGAPLGHDFCTISLSDLLTPWQAIEARIRAAAAGDFVIAFYNPVSRRRRRQLADARDILLQHRPNKTPVVLASNLGRAGENVRVTTLAALKVDDVDMLTLVLVGSSATRAYRAAGRTRVFTPRGYAAKERLKENAP